MGHKIVWSDTAINDLKRICDDIAQHNSDAARKIGEGIIDHVGILESFPFIGPAYPRGSGGPVRQIVFGTYRIFYEATEESVAILHVRHGARDEPLFLKTPN